jgi:hypothetical protein
MFWCKICKNLSRNDFTIIFWKKYGFGWLYRDFFLHFPILLTDDCIFMISVKKEKKKKKKRRLVLAYGPTFLGPSCLVPVICSSIVVCQSKIQMIWVIGIRNELAVRDTVITPTVITPTIITSTLTDSLCNSGTFSNPNAVRDCPFKMKGAWFLSRSRKFFSYAALLFLKVFSAAQQNILYHRKYYHMSYFPQNSG